MADVVASAELQLNNIKTAKQLVTIFIVFSSLKCYPLLKKIIEVKV